MPDATYQPKVYRKHGGAELVVASSGTLTVESGGIVNYQSGGYARLPVQSLGSSQVATTVVNYGLSVLTGTTTGPTYSLAAPVVGLFKAISLSATSSGATHRAVLNANSTGVSFDTTGGNQLTFATSALRGVSLVAETTAKWRIVGVYSGVSIAAAKST